MDPDLAGNPEFGRLDWDEALLDVNLGALYSHVEGLWDDCVWNSYKSERNANNVTFSPIDIGWQAREAISRTRYMSLGREFAVQSLQAQKNLLALGHLPSLGTSRVTGLHRSGKRQDIKLATFDTELDAGTRHA